MTTAVAPPSKHPATAALTSEVNIRRQRCHCYVPGSTSAGQVTPVAPSMSAEIRILMTAPCSPGAPPAPVTLQAELAGEVECLSCPAGVELQHPAALGEPEGRIDLAAAPVAVLPGLPDLLQGERRQPVVLDRRGPHAELDEPRVLAPARLPQPAQVALEDDLLEAGQVGRGDEVVPGGVGYQVPGVFADGPEAREAPVDEGDLTVGLADEVLGPEVEMAQRARQGLADLVEPLAVGVNEPDAIPQAGREGLADDRMPPGVVIVEQLPAGRLLRAVLPQEVLTQPGNLRQRPPGQERSLGTAERLGRRAERCGRPGFAGLAIGPLQQQHRFPVVDVRAQAGRRPDAASCVGAGEIALVGERLPAPVCPAVRVVIAGGPVRVP